MDLYASVFNCHVNDALEKAKKVFIETYGLRKYIKCIKPYIDNGVMSMFDEMPNKYTMFFALYIKRVVNLPQRRLSENDN